LAVQNASNWIESNVGKMTNLSMACAEQGEIPKHAMRLDVFVTTMEELTEVPSYAPSATTQIRKSEEDRSLIIAKAVKRGLDRNLIL
jgi:hypothetical protein